ncbi:hypothetical protein MPL1032_220006 [Mesorhizobium plurifarium]|uniref:Uncharacterized protein n=1 Tax=Mesorhizobium plurifarium TaxID=69974 RepID=A0A0K2VZG8_MESPL|nr:hypothetical protein MPL1032_220006 [Mesorhizobium plurifarium]
MAWPLMSDHLSEITQVNSLAANWGSRHWLTGSSKGIGWVYDLTFDFSASDTSSSSSTNHCKRLFGECLQADPILFVAKIGDGPLLHVFGFVARTVIGSERLPLLVLDRGNFTRLIGVWGRAIDRLHDLDQRDAHLAKLQQTRRSSRLAYSASPAGPVKPRQLLL